MKENNNKPIGVMDSGLGGLTAVRELGIILPQESIVYYGDNANCPYGNRSREEILSLSFAMLDFLKEKNVKIVAIACNTISTLIEELRKPYAFPIVSIIETTCEYVADKEFEQIGVFATEFTVKQGHYRRVIGELSPKTEVFSIPSRDLAMLVDTGHFESLEIEIEVKSLLNELKNIAPGLEDMILGCTHYPIVKDVFEKNSGGVNFINPAEIQAGAVRALLTGQLSEGGQPSLDIFTSGEAVQYEAAIKKLGIKRDMTINKL